MTSATTTEQEDQQAYFSRTNYKIIGGASASHFLNDAMQSLLIALYPLLKSNFQLTYLQVGFLTFAFQVTSSFLQPFVGHYTDKHPKPYLLSCCAVLTFCGLVLLTFAMNYPMLLLAAMMIGIGSSVFHPEASRIARLSSGGRFGFAQSLFQVGGNTGAAISPLVVALLIIPHGQQSVVWYYIVAALAVVIMFQLSRWYAGYLQSGVKAAKKRINGFAHLSRNRVIFTVGLLLVLIFSKHVYTASVTNFLMFFLMEKFHMAAASAQIYLFIFLAFIALGTFMGGPLGDRYGRKVIIWVSILGVAPFTILLPYANEFWAGVLIAIIGFVIASAFPAIIVFGQELMPHRVGMIAGMFYGFAFGMAGLTSVFVGELADVTSVQSAFQVLSFMPLLGIVVFFLPSARKEDSA